jgi:hypothetical protein
MWSNFWKRSLAFYQFSADRFRQSSRYPVEAGGQSVPTDSQYTKKEDHLVSEE